MGLPDESGVPLVTSGGALETATEQKSWLRRAAGGFADGVPPPEANHAAVASPGPGATSSISRL